MNIETIKKNAVTALEFWAKGQSNLDGQNIKVRDFDCWLGGLIAGLTYGNDEISELVTMNAKEITEYVVESKIAKSIGVTGTKNESFVVNRL